MALPDSRHEAAYAAASILPGRVRGRPYYGASHPCLRWTPAVFLRALRTFVVFFW